jgi:hypothetical protein
MRDRSNRFRSQQWPVTQVRAIQPQHIEHVEHRLATASKQVVKLWPAFGVQAHDLTVQHGFAIQRATDRGAHSGKGFVHVSATGYEPYVVGCDVRECAESIHLQLENVFRAVERFPEGDRCGGNEGAKQSSFNIAN